MSGFSEMEVLAAAIRAGRHALRDRKKDDVPASLRKVARYAGGRLPPPLATALLDGLDGDERLRTEAAERLPDDAPGADRAFLERPAGWWRVVADAASVAAAGEASDRVARMAADLATAQERRDETRRRLETARAEAEATEQQLREELDRERAPRRDAAEAERREREALAGRLRDAAAGIESRDRQIDRLEAELVEAQRRLRDVRRSYSEALAAVTTRRGTVDVDPLALARRLDELAGDLRRAVPRTPAPGADGDGEEAMPSDDRLPAGIAPDVRGAVEWLRRRRLPATVIVDGYNVTGSIAPDAIASPAMRGKLEDGLTRLRRGAGAPLTVIVVYDSAVEGERDAPQRRRDIEVRFAPRDRIADDEVIRLASAASGRVVVVSSDREVQAAAEDVGALVLWSEALAEWISRPG